MARVWLTTCLAALSVVCLAGATPALTVDQVIALHRAGVSQETIQAMIDTEIMVKGRGGAGRYVLRQADGAEVIVYQASTPRGIVEYPVPQAGDTPGAAQRLGTALGVYPSVSQALPGAGASGGSKPKPASKGKGGFTLHLASFQNRDYALETERALKAKGVGARLKKVEISGKGLWHRLLLGKFSSRSQARAEGDKLRQAGLIESYRVVPR